MTKRRMKRMHLSDPRVAEWIVDWSAGDREAAAIDASLYGNVAVTTEGRYVPWRDAANRLGRLVDTR